MTSGDSVGWAIEADTGRVRWQIDGVSDINNVAGAPAPAVNDDRVIFSFGGGTLQSAFRKGGLRLWNAVVAGTRNGFSIGKIDDITGDPLISGNTLMSATIRAGSSPSTSIPATGSGPRGTAR